MEIYNQSAKRVFAGLYDIADKSCLNELGGRVVEIAAGNHVTIAHGTRTKVQVIFWKSSALPEEIDEDGHASRTARFSLNRYCYAGPRTIFTDQPVTLVQEADGGSAVFFICNHTVDGTHPVTVYDRIEHVVVLMMENRTLDNLAGYLYEHDRPAKNIPALDPPRFDGLTTGAYENLFSDGEHVAAAKAGEGTWDPDLSIPSPGPVEVVHGFLEGIFGTPKPALTAVANMSGFIRNYHAHLTAINARKPTKSQRTEAELKYDAAQIMRAYTPVQIPYFSGLARMFAIGDRWFCSAPCQTWPNRSFVHAGTSFGRLNNLEGIDDEGEHPWYQSTQNAPPSGPYVYENGRNGTKNKLIFDVLDEQAIRWRVYNDSSLPSLAYMQFGINSWQWDPYWFGVSDGLVKDLDNVSVHPNYVFLEPQMFYKWPWVQQDFHPPSKVQGGDNTIKRVYELLTRAGVWHKTLLIITFDESGNTYDHVPPPAAIRPRRSDTPQYDASQIGTKQPFDMYGPRIPTVLISPYIDQGVVFRSDKAPVNTIRPEYDHCSILASLRDWIFGTRAVTGAAAGDVLTGNPRVVHAPTVWSVLDRATRRAMPNDLDVMVQELNQTLHEAFFEGVD